MGDAEAAGRALMEIARMAETEPRALDRAFRVLGDGALVGPAATRLWEDLARRHAQVRQELERAFASVEAIAAQGDRPPPRVALPHLRPAPVQPPRREVVGGDPDLIEILATEVTRAGRSWEDAGQGLRSILARVGADPSPGTAVAVAGDWVGAERRDLLHRRADLLKQVELEALEGGYAAFSQGTGPAADGPDPRTDAATTLGAAVAAALRGAALATGPMATGGTPTGGGAAGGAAAGAQGGPGAAGAALRALKTRLNPIDTMVSRLEILAKAPDTYATRGLSTRLNRMGLPALADNLTSLERNGRSYLLGVGESTAGLATQLWGATPTGAAINRSVESAQLIADPAGHAAETRAQLDGIIWGTQHPVEFAKAAADWETLLNDPARWTGRMTPDALLSAAGGGGLLGRAMKGFQRGAKVAPVEPSPPVVFRGDARLVDKIFKEGMTARDPTMNLEKHLAGGNGLIATSKSRMVARGFAIRHKGLVYEIDDIGNGIEVEYPKGFRHLAGEQEVVFTRIEPSQIRGAWRPGKFGAPDTWIPNPGHTPR